MAGGKKELDAAIEASAPITVYDGDGIMPTVSLRMGAAPAGLLD